MNLQEMKDKIAALEGTEEQVQIPNWYAWTKWGEYREWQKIVALGNWEYECHRCRKKSISRVTVPDGPFFAAFSQVASEEIKVTTILICMGCVDSFRKDWWETRKTGGLIHPPYPKKKKKKEVRVLHLGKPKRDQVMVLPGKEEE